MAIPRFNSKDKFTPAIELMDFPVYYWIPFS